jgi:hypothetical protein
MRRQNRKHGRKSSGQKHGGKDMKKAGKRHSPPKKAGSGKIGGLTLLGREQALAEADPFKRAPAPLPLPSSLPQIAPRPKSFADMIEKAAILARPVEAPRPGTLPVAVSKPSLKGSAETEALRKAVGVRPLMSRGRIAVMAFVMAAMGSVALVRACERSADPTEDDASAPGACSDDAALCIAVV